MKLGVYSCMTPDLQAEELCPALQENGYEAVEWTIGYRKAVWDPSSEWHVRFSHLDEDIPRFRRLSREYNLPIAGLGSIVSIHDTDLFPQVLDVAARLECPQVRLVSRGYNGSQSYRTLFDEARRALENVEKVSASTGVKALIEIHMRTIVPSASAAYRLVEEFNPEHVGVLFDPGNMVHEGMENWQMGMELLGPYLAHVHVKNYGWFRDKQSDWAPETTPLDEGIADYGSIIQSLRKVGYDGYLCLEDFRGGYGCVPEGITTREKLAEDFLFMFRIMQASSQD